MSEETKPTFVGTVRMAAAKPFAAVPKERLGAKIGSVLMGLLVAAIGGAIAMFLPHAPWYVPVGFVAVGANIASKEMLVGSLKSLAGIAVTLIKAVKGTNGAAP